MSDIIYLLSKVPPPIVVLIGNVRLVADRDSTTLTCTSESSNPRAELTWTRNGSGVTVTTTPVYLPGSNNGFRTEQTLTLRPMPADDGTRYACSASNDVQGSSKQSNLLTLDLFCKYAIYT